MRFFYRRPAVGHPVANRGGITFARLRCRPLERPAERPDDPPDMTGVIGHARPLLDHGRDARQGPQVRRKSVRLGALAERRIDARPLRRRQFRLTSGAPRPAQGNAAAPSPSLIPAAHTLAAHPQRSRDLGHDLAGRKQARRLTAALFQGVKVSARCYMGVVHAPIIREGAGNVTLFCEIR